ncbi:NADH:ubiquinone oxidoreductase 11.5kD subunit [Emericellopsis atlantica]|uniref:NADH dehydrogenase [ubiquinone] iron-sulfur protein 5 n=1 Tax=Emericellopsis atlantica TaxID=2614577 RepID=A0A9P8CKW5_9HYPO|nr:NADH:ubiquinone oxidoreductase 11.5kD subunit [Emericellopsis atlantica]KAG9250365.1 NADH:ubiquinone oxidoreductase 11.5kD subunit [Emericellopsis atlantica]
MSSGYGQYGGVGRCFPFWQEVLACYVVNTSAENDGAGKKKCAVALEDYYECLHHKKEHARAVAMQAAYNRRGATSGDDTPSASQIRNLGLLGKEEDTKKVIGES